MSRKGSASGPAARGRRRSQARRPAPLRRNARFRVPDLTRSSLRSSEAFGAAQVALNQGDACFRVETSVSGLYTPVRVQHVGGDIARVLRLFDQRLILLLKSGGM